MSSAEKLKMKVLIRSHVASMPFLYLLFTFMKVYFIIDSIDLSIVFYESRENFPSPWKTPKDRVQRGKKYTLWQGKSLIHTSVINARHDTTHSSTRSTTSIASDTQFYEAYMTIWPPFKRQIPRGTLNITSRLLHGRKAPLIVALIIFVITSSLPLGSASSTCYENFYYSVCYMGYKI